MAHPSPCSQATLPQADREPLHPLDIPGPARLDRLVRLAARLARAPIVLLALADAQGNWFSSCPELPVADLGRALGLCAHTLESEQPLLIPDLSRDPRFAASPLLNGPLALRFYAGWPIRGADGCRAGTLCVFDRRPRRLRAADLAILDDLARFAAEEVQLAQAREVLARAPGATTAGVVAELQAFLDNASDLIVSVTPELRFQYVNRAWRETLGYSAEALGQRTLLDLVVPSQVERVETYVRAIERGLVSGRIETTLLAEHGLPVELEGHMHVWRTADQQVVLRGIFRDITRWRTAEAALQRAKDELEARVTERTADLSMANARLRKEIAERQRVEAALEAERAQLARHVAERTADLSAANAALERASRMKDEFLASMSHELRTPLNAILVGAETLNEQVFGPLNGPQRGLVDTVIDSGRHLLALINDILDLSKVEAGQLELQLDTVDLAQLCEASLRMVRQLAHARQLRVITAIDSDVELIVADPRRLKQILVNLLSNAVKFTPDGGSIGLEVQGDRVAGLIYMTVWDTGVGIAAADQARLFRPFVQLDSSLARKHQGTGLGLALVARLTELHGGGVSLESEPGHGSRFTISLPWRQAIPAAGPAGCEPAAGADAAEPIAADGAPAPLLLLVDDHLVNINLVADYLLSRGYRVAVAYSGAQAVAAAQELQPALILMDIQMPGMDGLEAMRRIRATPALATTPIIALTALAMIGDRERCLAAGADDYLSKPVVLRELLARIAHYTGAPAQHLPSA